MHGALLGFAANALDLAQEKERIRQEVMQDTPDQTLIDELTEIRFKREVLMKPTAAEKSKSERVRQEVIQDAPKQAMIDEITDLSFKREVLMNPIAPEKSKSQSAVTASVGDVKSLGYEYSGKNSVHGFKVEINWRESHLESTVFDASFYSKHTSYRYVGAYYVNRPFENGFRVMTGIRFNEITNTYSVDAGSAVNVNGNRVTIFPQDHLIYRFSFPRITPFLGIGFVEGNQEQDGFEFFGDVGATLGRYSAQADTNISKSLNVDAKQIENELIALRNEKFSKRYLWTAKVGLRYRYQ